MCKNCKVAKNRRSRVLSVHTISITLNTRTPAAATESCLRDHMGALFFLSPKRSLGPVVLMLKNLQWTSRSRWRSGTNVKKVHLHAVKRIFCEENRIAIYVTLLGVPTWFGLDVDKLR